MIPFMNKPLENCPKVALKVNVNELAEKKSPKVALKVNVNELAEKKS